MEWRWSGGGVEVECRWSGGGVEVEWRWSVGGVEVQCVYFMRYMNDV